MKKRIQRKGRKQIIAMGMAFTLALTGILPSDKAVTVKANDVMEEVQESTMLTADDAIKIASVHSPICDKSKKTVEFSYIYFGSYPQSEVTGEALTADIVNADYVRASDVTGDAITQQKVLETAVVGDEKYCRMQSTDGTYRYFIYEPIRWRVIRKEGNEALLRSDLALDSQIYGDGKSDGWETRSLRYWLNSYGRETGFLKMAFTADEVTAINEKIYKNHLKTDVLTRDKVHLLTGPELYELGNLKESYELQTKASEFGYAIGITGDRETGYVNWWVRNAGTYSMGSYAGFVDSEGKRNSSVFHESYLNNKVDDAVSQTRQGMAVCPAIVLNLEKTEMWATEEEMEQDFVFHRGEVEAYSLYGKCGENVFYEIQKDGTLKITGTGSMYNYNTTSNVSPFSWNPLISKIIVDEGVETVGDYAFAYLSLVKDIQLPSSLKTIGNYAFYNMSSIEKIQLPPSLEGIGKSAFQSVSQLNGIEIPDSVTTIGERAFFRCSKLETVELSDKLSTIAKSVFYECENLKSIIIPDSVTVIGSSAFGGCKNLENVVLSSKLSSIEAYSFYQCDISTITFPDTLTSIGKMAFYNNRKLNDVTIPDSVVTVEEEAFLSCDSLENITISKNLHNIGSDVFEATKWISNRIKENPFVVVNGMLIDMKSVTGTAVIPADIKTISDGAYHSYSSPEKVVIPATVEKITYYAFAHYMYGDDLKKIYVEEGSYAETYFRNIYENGGFHIIKSDGSVELATAYGSELVPSEPSITIPTYTPVPIHTPVPTEVSTSTPVPTEVSTSTPVPTEVPITTPATTELPTATSVPTEITSNKPVPTGTTLTTPMPTEEVEDTTTGSVEVWLGDVNQDDIVNLQDAQMILKGALKIENVDVELADANRDHRLTLEDAQMILKAALKIIPWSETIVIELISNDSDTDDVAEATVKSVLLDGKLTGWEPFMEKYPDMEFYVKPPAPMKPVIYLYPEETTEIEVKLDFNGDFTFTWPDYRDGWKVIAQPDGKLTDTYDGSEHHYLFWEGKSNVDYTFSEGFCVKGEDTAGFLKDALEKQGLTPKEYNDFITFWVPRMQDNEYNVISFAEDVYTDNAELSFTMEPDTMKRVFMVCYGSDELVDIKEQELTGFEREGFTVVEWGGAEVPSNSYKK